MRFRPLIYSTCFAIIVFYFCFKIAPQPFLVGYLVAYFFWLQISLGAFELMLIHNLTGGKWGEYSFKQIQAASTLFPLLALMILPILLGAHFIYKWTDLTYMNSTKELAHKLSVLNIPFFVARTSLYFIIWIALQRWVSKIAFLFYSGQEGLKKNLSVLSGWACIIIFVTVSYASFDWGMSLDPHWYSTMYGVTFNIESMLSALAFVVFSSVRHTSDLADLKKQNSIFRDFGNLLLTFVMMWAYVVFSQYLIIWSGQIPEELTWYRARMQTAWILLGAGLIVFKFFIPLLLLLIVHLKKERRFLKFISLWLLAFHIGSLIWTVVPSFNYSFLQTIGYVIICLLCLGLVWKQLYLLNLAQQKLTNASETFSLRD
ncbi:MAG: hypothetical protein ACXWR0_15160 [Bdellovibrio sp.]